MNILLDKSIFRNNYDEEHFIDVAKSLSCRVVESDLTKTFTIDDFNEHYQLENHNTFVYGPIPFVRSRTIANTFKGNYLDVMGDNRYHYGWLHQRISQNNKHCFLNGDGKRVHGLLEPQDYHYIIGEFVSNYDVSSGKIFIKENNPYKIVTNRVINIDEFFDVVREYAALAKGFWIFPIKEIQHEVRAIVYNRRIVDASYYIINDEIEYKPFADIHELQAVLDESRVVDSASVVYGIPLVIDFAYSGGQWKILEINCISTASWYTCSVEKTLRTIKASLGK